MREESEPFSRHEFPRSFVHCPSFNNCGNFSTNALVSIRLTVGVFFINLFFLGSVGYTLVMNFAHFIHTFKHHWLTIAFILGFITDYILLNRVDDIFDNAMLLLYVLLATISMLLLYAGTAGRLGNWLSPKMVRLAPLAMQYSFGGLFSGMLIFYGHSGDIFASWPFLLLIIGAIAGNELVKNRGQQLVFNVLSYFVGLFSYLVLVIPVFTGKMGEWVFVGSGLLALFIVFILIRLLGWIIPNFMLLETRKIVFLVVGMFVVLNTLYFANIIPPIPLSLKEIVIAQSVIKFTEPNINYEVKYEKTPWWRVDERLFPTFHPDAGGAIYCFTRVYAPARINTDIYHRWEFINSNGKWQERFKLSFPITGKATQGYRGFTSIQNAAPGKWRCSVETTRGQVLGRQVFTIDGNQAPNNLVTEKR